MLPSSSSRSIVRRHNPMYVQLPRHGQDLRWRQISRREHVPPSAHHRPSAPTVLRWCAGSGLIGPDDVREMLAWAKNGSSLDASVRIAARDRAGLERLLRYSARPPFVLERLERLDAHRISYRLAKPQRDGITTLTLTPLEVIDHLTALIPPLRQHRHRYHGVLAPNSPLRAAAAAYGRDTADGTNTPAEVTPNTTPVPNARSAAH